MWCLYPTWIGSFSDDYGSSLALKIPLAEFLIHTLVLRGVAIQMVEIDCECFSLPTHIYCDMVEKRQLVIAIPVTKVFKVAKCQISFITCKKYLVTDQYLFISQLVYLPNGYSIFPDESYTVSSISDLVSVYAKKRKCGVDESNTDHENGLDSGLYNIRIMFRKQKSPLLNLFALIYAYQHPQGENSLEALVSKFIRFASVLNGEIVARAHLTRW